ncbi:conserved hypothetical protein [Paenibacillus curdlanolyticus YK9]|uniref:DUF4234 domain-containing protein n=1 Tax=Paenibacillus curdlanolyticus YK9 TaxID=717606 RepID=E0IFZ6_9BACL|nr:DUF4234 domain-containing protein [Paenibacillus curdlanolyticus]EFM08576.1 conserved hypothetical protein [Paenibacillus curdlanolyticus YK9]
MVNKRGVAAAIILSFITCGIYAIYWFIVMTEDAGKLSGDRDFTGGKHFLLVLVTCGIWNYIWAYQLGKHIDEAQRQHGLPVSNNSTLYVVLNIFGLGIVTYALAQADINRMAA